MYLKRLEITGFKSFAGRSVLDFEKGENVAAIVGPNGSGKSNVADAIRWVLGEQSYKSLRSKKSEDVIFSGSGGKAKGSMAKVAMVLDNSDGKAPIDFSEVQISRTVYRDGTGEYMIAGRKVRLADIAELLAKSGFGQSTYSVIGQGMVDSMLFYGPAERKVLFDEAAGVRAYELKREQTIKKLGDTTGNVIRIKDILSELNPRLSTLKRQAEKAKEKDTVSSNLLEKQKVFFSTIWDRITMGEKEKRSEIEKLVAEEEKVGSEIRELNQKFNEILGQEKQEGGDTKGLEAEILKLEEQKDEIRQKIFTLRAKLELSASAPTKKEIESQIEAAQTRIKEIRLEEKRAERDKLKSELDKNSRQTLQGKIEELDSEKDKLRQEIFTLRAQLEVQSNALSESEIIDKINQIEADLHSLDDRQITNQKSQHEKESEKLRAEVAKVEKKITEKRGKLSDLQSEFSGFDFGTVAEKVGAILYLQNDFLIQVEGAKKLEDVKSAIETGKKISERLKELRKQVGDVKDGRISGLTEIQNELEALTTVKESLVADISRHETEAMRLDYEVKKIGDRKFDLEKELGHLKTQKPADKSEKDSVEKKIEEIQVKIASIEGTISEVRVKMDSVATLASRISNLEFEITREENDVTGLEAEIKRLSNLKPAEKGERTVIESDISAHQAEIAEVDAKISAAKQELASKTNDFKAQSQALTEIKDALSAKQHLSSEYASAISNLRIEMARFDTKKQDLREEIAREMGSEAALVDAKVIPELDEGAARTEIEKLRGKLFAIGEIDSEVESEYEEVNERVTFMTTQIEDLEKAKADLEKLVVELDSKIKKQFESAFSAISAKFTHFFEILFEGGTAKLELVRSKITEDEEPGESNFAEAPLDKKDQFGIEITAIPPGKRVQNISALSGGERTMTSLALLFAILSVNPAPFCVLDEVDAALDESNTKRFLKIVEELSKLTQFIFITHNRETMKPANIIYGITMDESHTSRLLSVKLTDALKTVENKVAHPKGA